MGEKSTRSVPEIEREIAKARLSLADHVGALQSTVKSTLDWKRPVRRNPLPILGAAFAVGLLIGLR